MMLHTYSSMQILASCKAYIAGRSSFLPFLRMFTVSLTPNGRNGPRDLDHYNIESICPELIKFWHPTRNGDLRPSDVSVRSVKKVWWKCPKGPDHEWQSSPRKLYSAAVHTTLGCPFCENRMVSVTNSLATLYPEIASQWHPTRNGTVTPSKILPSSSFKAWWKCENGENHVWQRVVSHRVHPRSPIEGKCPFCQKVDLASQSLAVCRPDLAKEWDYDLNGSLTPAMVTKSSSRRVWWVCENGHHFQCTVYNRGSTHNTKCPICSGRKVNNETSLACYQDLIRFLDMKKNRGLFYSMCAH